jgi:hypothetical protein
MKQTAVEWFSEKTFNQIELLKRGYVNQEEFLSGMLKLRDQAKEMEKVQIMDAWIEAGEYGYLSQESDRVLAEQYYNETFNINDRHN